MEHVDISLLVAGGAIAMGALAIRGKLVRWPMASTVAALIGGAVVISAFISPSFTRDYKVSDGFRLEGYAGLNGEEIVCVTLNVADGAIPVIISPFGKMSSVTDEAGALAAGCHHESERRKRIAQ